MIKKCKKVFNNTSFFFIILFIFIFVLHLLFNFSNDDVVYFCNQLDKMSWFEFIKMRYETWTSRLLIESVLVYLSRFLFLWRLFDSFVICLLIYSINKLIFDNNKTSNLIFITGVFLVYPFFQMCTAGFCATTLNYLWPLSFLLFSFGLFRDLLREKKINKFLVPFYLLAYLYACNQEQTVCIAIVVSFLIFILKIKDKLIRRYSLIMLGIAISSFVFILTCPGNDIRNVLEINSWYPDYVNADIFDKIYLGVVSICSNLLKYLTVLWLFSFSLFVLVLKCSNLWFPKFIAILQFLVISILSVINGYSFIRGKDYLIFNYFTKVGNVFQFSVNDILIFLLCISLILSFCYLLYTLLKKESLGLIFVLLIGCGTRLLMGFSPTVFASGSRTMIFLDFSILLIVIYLWKKYKNLFSVKKLKIFYIIILGLDIISYLFLFITIF